MDADELDQFHRSVAAAIGTSTGADLDDALAALGWSDALHEDPRAAISVLFELQGRANATSSAIDQVLRAALGTTVASVVLPCLDRDDPPGTVAAGRLTVDGLATFDLTERAHATVVVRDRDGDGDGDGLCCVTVPTSALDVHEIGGVDPDAGLLRVTGSLVEVDVDHVLEPAAWSSAVASARLAVAHEIVGASRRMLQLACEHALGRVQFGVNIASFQAIRHRLAETLVAIEAADAVIDAAWIDGSGVTAAMAKAVAGRGARTTARHCQQTLAGIGFTTEHDLHRFVRRTLLLDGLFASATTLTRRLGDELLATRALPRLLPL